MKQPRTTTLFVSGICCSSEEAVLRKRVDATVGRDRYTFNPLTSELVIPMENQQAVADDLRRAGFGLRVRREMEEDATFRERHGHALLLGLAFVLAVAGVLTDQVWETNFVSRAFLLSAIVIGGWRVFRKAIASAISFSLDMNFLMTVAVIGAIGIDRWSEGAAVILLFGLSLLLESYSVRRTRRAVDALMSTAPAEATVIRGSGEQRVLSSAVSPGEVVLVRPGERIPLDGLVIEGGSAVDQSAMTGESTPVRKEPGMDVYAGTLNGVGVLKVKVTKRQEDTMLARIIHTVEEAQQKKAPVQLFVDRFAGIYTPSVFILAVLLAAVPPFFPGESASDWLYRALVLLVIACPCALVISTPVTIVSAITGAARRGILIKGGKQIETISRLRAIAFDKTGTITHGRPDVTDIVPLNSMPRDEAIRLAAALEHRSEHHIAAAVVRKADAEGIAYRDLEVTTFEAFPGMGIRGRIGNRMLWLGSREFSKANGPLSGEAESVLANLSAQGKTVLVFGEEDEAIAIIAVSDSARHGVRDTIRDLRTRGISGIEMLSGDDEAAARSVAGSVGVTEVSGRLLPEAKVQRVRDLMERYGTVAMVGDGVNDAPALATASVGISMGVKGTDAALETSDVVLMADDIGRIPGLLDLSRKAMRVIRQNIILALVMKGLFLLLSVSGVATLWMAVLADDGTALAVILNGLRLLRQEDGGGAD